MNETLVAGASALGGVVLGELQRHAELAWIRRADRVGNRHYEAIVWTTVAEVLLGLAAGLLLAESIRNGDVPMALGAMGYLVDKIGWVAELPRDLGSQTKRTTSG